jgi:outer membrane receptor protein involved in Fe transport
MRFATILATMAIVPCSFLFAPCASAADEESGEGVVVKPPKEEEKEERGAKTALTQDLQGEGGLTIQTMCTNCNSADLSLGGLDNAHVEMMCDGLPVPEGLAQIYLLSVMPPTLIDNVEVQKGAGRAALSGRAIGGRVAVTRRPPKEGMELNLSADAGSDGWDAQRFDGSARWDWFGLNLAASAAESDMIFADEDDVPDSPLFERYTNEARAHFHLSDDHVIRVGGSNYQEEQEMGRAAWSEVEQTWNYENVDFGRQQYDVTYDGYFDDGTHLTAAAMYSERESDIDETLETSLGSGNLQFGPAYDIYDQREYVHAEIARPLGMTSFLRGGVSWDRRDVDAVDFRANIQILPPSRVATLVDLGLLPSGLSGRPLFDALFDLWETFAATERVEESGAWVEAEFMTLGKLDVSLGLRWVDYLYEDNLAEYRQVQAISNPASFAEWQALSLPQGSRVLPRAAVAYKPARSWHLRASAGTGYRVPDPTFDEVCCGRQFRGNRGVEAEKSLSVGFETEYQPSPDLSVAGSVFWTDFEDQTVKVVSQATRNLPTYQNVSFPETRYLSLDLQFNASLLRWLSFKASTTWIDAAQRSPGDEVPAYIDPGTQTPVFQRLVFPEVPYVAERTASLGFEMRWRRTGVVLNLDSQYKGSMYIQNFEELERSSLPPANSRLETGLQQTPGFWVFNARLSKRLFQGVDLFAGVDNIGDYVQEDLINPATDYTWGPLRGRYIYAGLSYRMR